ncbi:MULTISPECIES: TetR/AcrR family transcriptional regulator [Achromobacter]|uniref:TetR/AcrR family transcriptional regulator n=1 Tax=Achromobacter spanius TaxID=217203 RepID=A0ABY8GXM0_9BURK|nr:MULTISPECIES: TetR/AcrR family transcriptional regulator [Achromobacter]WAI81450.1 TetR/AcrR family transcriptional regulator [Achromobacter spanius]WEX96967.1 TetR/AcrR family transcriptional regulator [Achromobacter sp. SS2-2022]WFP09316.1 TetR/AcrR family transcriptional regulator [Achromobacter spanius]
MNSFTIDSLSSTQERLLRATEHLIYQGGIHATGMDLIVKTSGVARKSLYKHYPNKDALVAAALQARDERWMQWFIVATTQAATPRERLLSIFDALQEWFESDGFRGCAFINAAGEISDPANPIREVSRLHKTRLLEHVLRLAQDAKLPDPGEAARQLLVLIDGAIAVALVTGDVSITASAQRAAAALFAAGK